MKAAWVLIFSCLVSVEVAAQGGVDGFNKLIALELGLLNSKLQAVIPASYGNCGASTSSGPAPTPCQDTGDNLWHVHKHWEYDAEVRWVTGLNTLDFTSVVLTNTSGTGLDGVMGNGTFAELPASVHIEQCATFDKCTKLWDNTHACCGKNKKFGFKVAVGCDTNTHQLTATSLKSLYIDDFELQENIGVISLPAADITDAIHGVLVEQLTKYLTQPVISHNNTEVTLVQYLNDVGAYYVNQLC
jgi:hypothetical protein